MESALESERRIVSDKLSNNYAGAPTRATTVEDVRLVGCTPAALALLQSLPLRYPPSKGTLVKSLAKNLRISGGNCMPEVEMLYPNRRGGFNNYQQRMSAQASLRRGE